jgi:hypothetical protein
MDGGTVVVVLLMMFIALLLGLVDGSVTAMQGFVGLGFIAIVLAIIAVVEHRHAERCKRESRIRFAMLAALDRGETTFEFEGKRYAIIRTGDDG